MSRCHQFRVLVRGYRPDRISEICGALHSQWDFDFGELPQQEDPPPEELDVSGIDNLCGGLSADEMADRLACAVWAANEAYCEVEARSTYLDVAPPWDTHSWTDGDYQEWLEEGGPASDE